MIKWKVFPTFFCNRQRNIQHNNIVSNSTCEIKLNDEKKNRWLYVYMKEVVLNNNAK